MLWRGQRVSEGGESASASYGNKRQALGCTGGQHRSVYMVQRLAKALRSADRPVQIRHRDLHPIAQADTV